MCLLLLLDSKRIRRFHLAYQGSGIGLEHHRSPIGCKTHIPKSWTIELRESERTFTPKRQTGRKIACPLVHCAWLTWSFSCLCKFAVDYQCHTKLCVDLQGCSGVQDEAVQAIAAATKSTFILLHLWTAQLAHTQNHATSNTPHRVHPISRILQHPPPHRPYIKPSKRT